jgi:hypothetical protein
MRRLMPALRVAALVVLTVANFLFRLFGTRDYMLFAGLALMGYGLALVSPPTAFIVPGAILASVAITISLKGGK